MIDFKKEYGTIFEFNHITKHDKLFLSEQLLNSDIDINRNIIRINANNSKNVSLDISLDNKFYFDLRSVDYPLQSYSQNSLHLVGDNTFKSSKIRYGFDYFKGSAPYIIDSEGRSDSDQVLPNLIMKSIIVLQSNLFSFIRYDK